MTEPQRTLRERYQGQRILLTGASGFLGQAVLEKILRALPTVEQVVVLMRPQAGHSTSDRMDAIMRSPLFRRLRSEREGFLEWWPTKVTIVDGVLDQELFGLRTEAWAELAGSITAIIHAGALTAFRRPLDHALAVNTMGAVEVLALAEKAGNVPMVYVSTAYVCGKHEGDHAETPFPWGHTPRTLQGGTPPTLDPEEEVRSLLGRCGEIRARTHDGGPDDEVSAEDVDRRVAALGRSVANRNGWPDPYPMSKALAEQLLVRNRGDVPLAIVRPTVISSTLAEPEPGWLVGVRMADPIIAAAGVGALNLFPGHPDTVLDLIPCDFVVNAILAALPARGDSTDPSVFHVGTSSTNPLTLATFRDVAYEAAVAGIRFYDKRGRAYKPSNLQIQHPAKVRLAWTRQGKRLRVLAKILARVGLTRLSRRIRTKVHLLGYARILAKAYEPYSVRQYRFHTVNLRGLQAGLCIEDRVRFPMEPQAIDWPSYVGQVHLRAVRREAGCAPAPQATADRTQTQTQTLSEEPKAP